MVQINSNKVLLIMVTFLIASAIPSCSQDTKKFESPAGYDLSEPVKYNMRESLLEISGIAFNKGNADTIYAIQDEEGRLFWLNLENKEGSYFKFGKAGDYEDVSISRGWVVVLRSNGKLYTFPLSDALKKNPDTDIKEFSELVPKGEYESMYADEHTGKVYVLVKNSKLGSLQNYSNGYSLDLGADGSLTKSGEFSIDVKAIQSKLNKKEKKFELKASAMAIHPLTKQWYILSAVNKLLVITDASWNIKEVYRLDPNLFNQAEGIAFDSAGNLYISNEGDTLIAGNIMKFFSKRIK